MKKVMTVILFLTFWLLTTFSLLVTPAYADVKCGNVPMPFGKEGLAATWASPAPRTAKVTLTDGSIFNTVAQVTGPEIPKDFPEKYTKNLQRATVFNLLEQEKDSTGIFKDDLKTDNLMFGTLVESAKGAAPSELIACSIVLQRGVIIYDNQGASVPKETLFLRAYFHSATNSENFVNFVPRTVIQMSFPSETVWFPLEPSRVIQGSASYVVLDILTPKPLNVEPLPKPFQIEKTGQMQYQGKGYSVVRITGKLAANEEWTDLRLTGFTNR
jgi:hypothetical protein